MVAFAILVCGIAICVAADNIVDRICEHKEKMKCLEIDYLNSKQKETP